MMVPRLKDEEAIEKIAKSVGKEEGDHIDGACAPGSNGVAHLRHLDLQKTKQNIVLRQTRKQPNSAYIEDCDVAASCHTARYGVFYKLHQRMDIMAQ